jgi:hypothetical protein
VCVGGGGKHDDGEDEEGGRSLVAEKTLLQNTIVHGGDRPVEMRPTNQRHRVGKSPWNSLLSLWRKRVGSGAGVAGLLELRKDNRGIVEEEIF